MGLLAGSRSICLQIFGFLDRGGDGQEGEGSGGKLPVGGMSATSTGYRRYNNRHRNRYKNTI